MAAGNKHADKSAKAERAGVGRREFFRKLGGASLIAANAVAVGSNASADSETNDEKRKARYRVTEDVRNYYRVNRYPS